MGYIILIVVIIVVIIAIKREDKQTEIQKKDVFEKINRECELEQDRIEPIADCYINNDESNDEKKQELEDKRAEIFRLYENCHTLDFEVAGVSHRSRAIKDIIPYLNIKDEIKLVKEPTNQYDKYAVKVVFDRKKVGYVPRKHSKMVTHMIEEGMIQKIIVDRAGISRIYSWEDGYIYLYLIIFFE